MMTDPFFYAAALPAVLLVGISKSGFGGALGSLAVPLLALVVPPSQGAAIMLPLLIALDVLGLMNFRALGDRANLVILIPAAIVGIIVGALTFRWMTDALLRIMIGVIALVFVVQRFFPPKAGSVPAGPSIVRGGLWGAVAGFTSFIANAGGPPFTIYMLPQKLDKMKFAGTSVLFFASVNFVKLVPFILLGLFDSRNLTTSLMLLPVVPFGYWIGLRLLRWMSQQLFYRMITLAMAVTGVKLLWEGIRTFA